MKTKYKFEMLFECDCCDKLLPESKLIWVQEENGIFVVTTIRDGNQLCFGSSCWKKIQKQQKNMQPANDTFGFEPTLMIQGQPVKPDKPARRRT